MMDDWSEVVSWLATGGAVAVVAWFCSWFLEGFGWWSRLESHVKSLAILLIALLIGLLATWIRLQPAEALEKYVPYANMAVLTIVAWLGTQVAHRVDGRRTTDDR
jgi:hypothetical protein